MAGELVIVIVPAAVADAARDQMENKDTVVFADAEALRALEAISTRRPGKVLLERRFAKTSRGNALVNRLRADPSLAHVQIDTIDYTPEPALATPRQSPSVTVVEDPPPSAPAPVGSAGTCTSACAGARTAGSCDRAVDIAARQVGHAACAAGEASKMD